MLTSYLALDVGRARIGVALANDVARIAAPLPAITNNEDVFEELQRLTAENNISTVVVGWPRSLDGAETDQTRYVDEFIQHLQVKLGVPVETQDEAATSLKAEAELKARGKDFEKGDIDSLSAVYILEDFLQEGVH